jgi:membrane-associated HD superfamily phosphohydrolase
MYIECKTFCKYKMSLLIICDQIELHINFYVVFCFMIKKKMSDYRWALNQLKILYISLKILNLIFFVIDMKKRLMIARYLIFSNFNHLLCIWHINSNVLINCQKNIVIKRIETNFFQIWKNVIYVSTKSRFRKIWNAFSNKYNLFHEDYVKYLINIYIRDHRRRFVKMYIT